MRKSPGHNLYYNTTSWYMINEKVFEFCDYYTQGIYIKCAVYIVQIEIILYVNYIQITEKEMI